MIVVSLAKLQAVSAEVREAFMKGVFTDCMTREGATDAELQEAFARKAPSTTGGKCIHACAHENLGMTKDSKVQVNEVSEMMNKGFDNKKIAATMIEVVHDCGEVTDADRCEMAAKLVDCFATNMVKRGLDPVNLA